MVNDMALDTAFQSSARAVVDASQDHPRDGERPCKQPSERRAAVRTGDKQRRAWSRIRESKEGGD